MSWREIVELYRITELDRAPNLQPRADIRPTTDILIVRDHGDQREGAMARWWLIPASGFYEWKDEGDKRKTRYYITTKSGAPLTFAGLWERNDILDVESCTIIVTQPNKMMAEIHNRMPVVLAEDDWESWLAEPREDLLKPAPEDDLIAYPVRSDIKDDDPAQSLTTV